MNLEKVVFYIPKVLKKSTQAFHSTPIDFKAYEPDESICPIGTLAEYIKAIEQYRQSQNLILSYFKCGTVKTQTVCCYVKQTLKVAVINTNVSSAHSTRHPTTSKTFMKGVKEYP